MLTVKSYQSFSCNSNRQRQHHRYEEFPQIQEEGSRQRHVDRKSPGKSSDNRLWMAQVDATGSDAKARKSRLP